MITAFTSPILKTIGIFQCCKMFLIYQKRNQFDSAFFIVCFIVMTDIKVKDNKSLKGIK